MGFKSTEGSMLVLLSDFSLLADETPLELLVRLPFVIGVGLSGGVLNSFSRECWALFCWYGLLLGAGGPRGIIERAGLDDLLDPATGRTLSGGHFRAGRADPGRGMLLPPLCGMEDDLKRRNPVRITQTLLKTSKILDEHNQAF